MLDGEGGVAEVGGAVATQCDGVERPSFAVNDSVVVGFAPIGVVQAGDDDADRVRALCTLMRVSSCWLQVLTYSPLAGGPWRTWSGRRPFRTHRDLGIR